MTYIIIGPSMNWLTDDYLNIIRENFREANILRAFFKEFPDGESYVRIPLESLDSDEDIVIIHSISLPQDRTYFQLLQLIDALLNLGGEKITVFTPYLAYARQDKVFMQGEPVSVRIVLNSIFSIGGRVLYTVDIHNPRSLSYFPGKAINLMPLHLLIEPILKETHHDIVVVAPDKGAEERAKVISEMYRVPHVVLKKKRDRISGEISLDSSDIDVKNKAAVLIDDIISTGGTISLAGKMMYDKGAKEVYVACSHALMAENSHLKIEESGIKKIFAFNTLPPKKNIIYVDVISWSLGQIMKDILIR